MVTNIHIHMLTLLTLQWFRSKVLNNHKFKPATALLIYQQNLGTRAEVN